MDIEVAVRARLLSLPAVTALVAREGGVPLIDAGFRRGSTYPALLLFVVSQTHPQDIEGDYSDTRQALLQFDAWARTRPEATALITAVRRGLTPGWQQGAAEIEGISAVAERRGTELGSDTSLFHRASMDAQITWNGDLD